VQVVLAVLAALCGGLIGHVASAHADGVKGAIVLGAATGFTLVWAAMAVPIWIVEDSSGASKLNQRTSSLLPGAPQFHCLLEGNATASAAVLPQPV
jgi:hypothetical protein